MYAHRCEDCGHDYDKHDHYNIECDTCCASALSHYVDALDEFIQDPKHWFDDDYPVKDQYKLADLMAYEYNMAKFNEEWDCVNGSYHSSMYHVIYRVESSWRAGKAVSIEAIKEYRDEMKRELQQINHKEQ